MGAVELRACGGTSKADPTQEADVAQQRTGIDVIDELVTDHRKHWNFSPGSLTAQTPTSAESSRTPS